MTMRTLFIIVNLKGKGVKNMRSDTYGDQYVQVNVSIPKKLSKKEKDLYMYNCQRQDYTKKIGILNIPIS